MLFIYRNMANNLQSIWSTQNGPSNPTTLIYVCVIVGLVTYLIVFNLNLIVHTCAKTYRLYKDHLVQSMRQERNETWRRRSECYDVFRPVHERQKPTEWLLLWYVVWRAVISVWEFGKRKEDNKNVDADEADEP